MKDLTVYSSDSCHFCTALKEYLKEKNVPFTEKNVSRDAEARKELMEMGHMGVPVTICDGQEIVGFDQAKIDELLGL